MKVRTSLYWKMYHGVFWKPGFVYDMTLKRLFVYWLFWVFSFQHVTWLEVIK